MAGFGKITPSPNNKKGSKNGPQLLEAAVRAHKIGDIQNAEALYQKVINSGFHHEAAFSNLGVIYKNSGREEKAIAIYERAITQNPNFADAYTNLGDLYKDLGKLDQALVSTLKSLELKPDNPTAFMNLGGIYKDLGQLDEALASTLKSLELKPDNSTAYMNLGSIYKDLGNFEQALTSTLKSLKFKPDNPDALINLGGIYKDLGNLDKALESTLKSVELKPNNPTAYMNLGGIYKDLDKLDQALTSTLKSLELHPDNPDTHINLGEMYFELAEDQKAEEEFNLAKDLTKQPKDAAIRGIAACRFRKGDYTKAVDLVQRMLYKKNIRRDHVIPREAEIKSIIFASQKKEDIRNPTAAAVGATNAEDNENLVKIAHREVENSLITELYAISTRKLSNTRDARNGLGFCTDFELFTHSSPQIKRLESDLKIIIKESLGKMPCSFKYNSFFNIFKAGSGTAPHNHLELQDKKFNLWKHKYSLVYYIDPGCQDCNQPGILKMHEPEIEILPKKGMILIIPATRVHSSSYGGSKDRLMVGTNFYAFDPGIEEIPRQ